MHIFDKDIVVPESLARDVFKVETSAEDKKFCIIIVNTLKMLDQGAP